MSRIPIVFSTTSSSSSDDDDDIPTVAPPSKPKVVGKIINNRNNINKSDKQIQRIKISDSSSSSYSSNKYDSSYDEYDEGEYNNNNNNNDVVVVVNNNNADVNNDVVNDADDNGNFAHSNFNQNGAPTEVSKKSPPIGIRSQNQQSPRRINNNQQNQTATNVKSEEKEVKKENTEKIVLDFTLDDLSNENENEFSHSEDEEEKFLIEQTQKEIEEKGKNMESTNFNNNESLNNIKENNNNSNTANNKASGAADSNYAAYFCTKVAKINLISSEFTFNQENETLFYVKTTGLLTDHIYISLKSLGEVKVKEKQYNYVITVTKNRTHFVLQKVINSNENNNNNNNNNNNSNNLNKNNSGLSGELLVIDFDNDYGEEYGPRKIEMIWPTKNNLKYLSRIPRRSATGAWQLNFNGKYVLESQKNAIILDERGKPSILIRKIEKQVLEIEVIHMFDPIDICALAVSSFVCPI